MVTGVQLLNIGLAFIEGVGLIVSPCILPILPIILSASLDGSKRRPLGVIVGFIISFTLFTLFSRQLVLLFHLNLNYVRYFSFALLLILGCIMLSNFLTEKFSAWTQAFADIGMRFTQNNQSSGFASGLVFGALVGLIWTPCAGPILAAVIVQTILQQSNIISFFTILAFGLGVAVPMLIIIFFGRVLINKINFLQKHAQLLRKLLGAIIIVAVLLMMFGADLYESKIKIPQDLSASGMNLQDGLLRKYSAPDFTDIQEWINSKPLHIQDLRGKVVLVDFWAYSCINCIRTLPYLKDWYNKYKDKGFVIIGVHSPEFDFERDPKNVTSAVKDDGILYPIALDNQFATWKNYNNAYWPAHYLIDKQGDVVYEHFGEGEYDVTENNIRYLLGINTPLNANVAEIHDVVLTPETYLGYARGLTFANNHIVKDSPHTYSYSADLPPNTWSLRGSWIVQEQKIVSNEKNASIKINFRGRKVFAVMSKQTTPIKVQVKLNGKMIAEQSGKDVNSSIVNVDTAKLYNLVDLKHDTNGILELTASEPGLEIYTFTFGS